MSTPFINIRAHHDRANLAAHPSAVNASKLMLRKLYTFGIYFFPHRIKIEEMICILALIAWTPLHYIFLFKHDVASFMNNKKVTLLEVMYVRLTVSMVGPALKTGGNKRSLCI